MAETSSRLLQFALLVSCTHSSHLSQLPRPTLLPRHHTGFVTRSPSNFYYTRCQHYTLLGTSLLGSEYTHLDAHHLLLLFPSGFRAASMPFHGPSCGVSSSQRCMANDVSALEVPLPVLEWSVAGASDVLREFSEP